MSTSDNTCADDCCQGCTESLCQGCADSCTARCEENCQESCNQACSDACSNACSNACSSSTCSCGTTTEIAIFPLILAFAGALASSVLIGIIQAFDSQGPILMTLFGSTVLAMSLSGIRINQSVKPQTCNMMKYNSKRSFSTRIGRISVNHSHHPVPLVKAGHEFRIKNKYFCTGCYGLLLGTLLSVLIGTLYVVNGISTIWINVLPVIIPLCFIPIILRYILPYKIPSSLKLIANSLLPVGCCLSLILSDFAFQNWIFNVAVVLLIISGAFLRDAIAQRENKMK